MEHQERLRQQQIAEAMDAMQGDGFDTYGAIVWDAAWNLAHMRSTPRHPDVAAHI